MSFFSKMHSQATFKPIHFFTPGHRCYEDYTSIHGCYELCNIDDAIKCPDGKKLEDWFATHAVEFYNQLVIFYKFVENDCTEEKCPVMSAGHKFKYLWQDDDQFKTPKELPAKEYVSLLFDWADAFLGDKHFFPSDHRSSYPKTFKPEISRLFRRLLRVYAHLYNHHTAVLKSCDALQHFNTSFTHFYKFTKYYNLIDEKEFKPLKKAIESLGLEPKSEQ
ncbi:Mob1/phocein family protein [Trichomonas vaginalis G3]|uniref:Mob1/phocein family protein n=1 Tax=Trichomonas vaginalis (strain ATCC PRA-98 / G3) TaxID=412133 RepID=A2EV98_TRIV3|nr:Mob1/phocein family [Trichomonas vaginalis G3]EAY03412.1 Mob1/phocein family protein [Trichomonas vaginalis G3]KAI5540190.1 Mob1/phocein family [Trichomonas vaginalis G3]|eukprot:XP_001315635.1 Mob1/phocein family protein [Trichomonas vaginalis G3]